MLGIGALAAPEVVIPAIVVGLAVDAYLGYRLYKSRAANVRQNKQFDQAVPEINQRCGKQLSKDQIRQLHDAISKQGYTPQEIVEIGVGMFCPGE